MSGDVLNYCHESELGVQDLNRLLEIAIDTFVNNEVLAVNCQQPLTALSILKHAGGMAQSHFQVEECQRVTYIFD